MTKQERLEFMRKRFPQMEQDRTAAILSVSKSEIDEAAQRMDTYREFTRERSDTLTSDEE